jgi:hypothetical protein
LAEVTGTVTVERGATKLRGRDRLELQSGDRVTVAATGTASIIWPEYGRTVLGAGTTLELSRAEMPDRRSRMRVWIRLQSGRIWTRLQRLLVDGSSFDVQAGDVVATVRGTSFGVFFVGDKVSVRVVESQVAMWQIDEPEAEPVVVSAGEVMEVPAADETPVSEWSEPQPMTPTEQLDPMMQEGDEIIPPEMLLYEPAPETGPTVEPVAPESALDMTAATTVTQETSPTEVPTTTENSVSAPLDPLPITEQPLVL